MSFSIQLNKVLQPEEEKDEQTVQTSNERLLAFLNEDGGPKKGNTTQQKTQLQPQPPKPKQHPGGFSIAVTNSAQTDSM